MAATHPASRLQLQFDDKQMRYPCIPYVLPFAAFVALLAVLPRLTLGPLEYPLWVAILSAALWFFSRSVIDLRVARPAASIALGIAVFAVWIGPDLLAPAWRSHWLLQNALTGAVQSGLSTGLRQNGTAIAFRLLRAVILVPILEELFWRAWLMRWLIHPNFSSVPLGAFSASAFWISALLFASEHGPFWDVGLIAGIAYNLWMIRTRSLGDCILAHAVTNACLSAYVLVAQRWEYWM